MRDQGKARLLGEDHFRDARVQIPQRGRTFVFRTRGPLEAEPVGEVREILWHREGVDVDFVVDLPLWHTLTEYHIGAALADLEATTECGECERCDEICDNCPPCDKCGKVTRVLSARLVGVTLTPRPGVAPIEEDTDARRDDR